MHPSGADLGILKGGGT